MIMMITCCINHSSNIRSWLTTSHQLSTNLPMWSVFHCLGSYGINIEMSFTPERLCLLTRGWVVAFCHQVNPCTQKYKIMRKQIHRWMNKWMDQLSDFFACFRGGGELGRQWYHQATQQNKHKSLEVTMTTVFQHFKIIDYSNIPCLICRILKLVSKLSKNWSIPAPVSLQPKVSVQVDW